MGGFPGVAGCLRSGHPALTGAAPEQRADLLDDPQSLIDVRVRLTDEAPALTDAGRGP